MVLVSSSLRGNVSEISAGKELKSIAPGKGRN